MDIAIEIPMQKSFVNFLYWLLVKSTESYYSDSLKSKVPYTPYFEIFKVLLDINLLNAVSREACLMYDFYMEI